MVPLDSDLAEVSRTIYDQTHFLLEDYPVTSSIGITTTLSSDREWECLFRQADQAMYTAKAIADRFGLEVTPLPEVREFHFGEWEGLTYNQICEGWPAAIENFFDKPDELQAPNGESFPVVQQRAVAGINELVKKHEGQVIAIVAHGAVNRTILAEALGLPLRNLWRIRQDNTAVNVIRYDEGFRNVELVNSTFHLSERPSGGAPQNR